MVGDGEVVLHLLALGQGNEYTKTAQRFDI